MLYILDILFACYFKTDYDKNLEKKLNYYKKLIEIRKNNDTIIYGDYKLVCPEDKNIFAYIRELNGDKILVVCNFYCDTVNFKLNDDFNFAEILLSNYDDSSTLLENLTLRPYEAIMYRLK